MFVYQSPVSDDAYAFGANILSLYTVMSSTQPPSDPPSNPEKQPEVPQESSSSEQSQDAAMDTTPDQPAEDTFDDLPEDILSLNTDEILTRIRLLDNDIKVSLL